MKFEYTKKMFLTYLINTILFDFLTNSNVHKGGGANSHGGGYEGGGANVGYKDKLQKQPSERYSDR